MSAAPAHPFSAHAKAVTRSLSRSFAGVLTGLGADPKSLTSIIARTGVNKTLAWKLTKIVQAEDPALVLKQMPGAAGIKIFFEKARRAGADAGALEVARQAVAEYQSLIETHSGDRSTLGLLGGSISPAGRKASDDAHRKLLFQGASYIWGVQARLHLKVAIIGPGRSPGLADFASLTGFVDFRRLRPDVSWVMASRQIVNDDGTDMAAIREEALDPRHDAPDRPPLVEPFCSHPLPTLRPVPGEAGNQCTFELVEGPVGNSGLLTCAVGTITRGLPAYASPGNEWGGHIAASDTPAEWLIVDQLVHRDFLPLSNAGELPVSVSLHGQLRIAPHQFGPRTQLPLSESLHDLGEADHYLPTPEFPQHDQVLDWMFRRTGWTPGEFRAFRIKIAHPVTPSALVLKYRLPDKG